MSNNPVNLFHAVVFWLRQRLTTRQFLLLSSVFVGISSALAVIVLKLFAHAVFEFATDLNRKVHFQSISLILPVIGIVTTVFIIKRVLGGHLEKGTWRIIYAITKQASILPRTQMYAQIITSSVTVGFGGSAGLESPVTITGAAFGSNYARQYRLSIKERTLLLACGVAAGIAAAFNAPIAGVLFTMEVLLSDIGITAFIPLMLAAASGALISGMALSDTVLLSFKGQQTFDFSNIPFYIVLGCITGLLSVYHSRMFTRVEEFFERLHWNRYTKAIVGSLLLSALILVFPSLFGEGYESLRTLTFDHPERLLRNGPFQNFENYPLVLLLAVGAITFLKSIATGITLGSGGNGGNFAPSLFVGGYAGFAFSYGWNLSGLTNPLPVTNFTMVGMAGMLSGLFHAPLTALFLIAEITGGYSLMIPLMIVSSISFAISKRFIPHSMDTIRLAEEGHVMRADKDKHILSTIEGKDLVEPVVVRLKPSTTVYELFQAVRAVKQAIIPIETETHTLVGMIDSEDLHELVATFQSAPQTPLEKIMRPVRYAVREEEQMEAVMDLFERTKLDYLPIINNERMIGYFSKSQVLEAYRRKIVENMIE